MTKTIYKAPNGTGQVTIENKIVTQSDAELCIVGQKPNMGFLKACGWKKLPNTVVVTDMFGGKRSETIYR